MKEIIKLKQSLMETRDQVNFIVTTEFLQPPRVINSDQFHYYNDYFFICSCLNQWNYFFRADTKYHGRLYFGCPSQDKYTNLWLLCNLPASIQISLENSIVSDGEILWLFIMFSKTLMVFLELVCIGHLYVFLSWRQTTWSILNIVKKTFFLTFSH